MAVPAGGGAGPVGLLIAAEAAVEGRGHARLAFRGTAFGFQARPAFRCASGCLRRRCRYRAGSAGRRGFPRAARGCRPAPTAQLPGARPPGAVRLRINAATARNLNGMNGPVFPNICARSRSLQGLARRRDWATSALPSAARHFRVDHTRERGIDDLGQTLGGFQVGQVERVKPPGIVQFRR